VSWSFSINGLQYLYLFYLLLTQTRPTDTPNNSIRLRARRQTKIGIPDFSQKCVCTAGKIAEFVDGSPCSFVAVIDFAFMVYFNFFGCVLAPLIAMFAMYSYIYAIVRRHITRIADMMASQAVATATVQPQDQDVSQRSSSTSREVTAAAYSSNMEMTAPTTRKGKALSTRRIKNARLAQCY